MSESDSDDNQFPVLKDVVSPGDASIIKTSRLGQEVLRDLEKLEQRMKSPSPADLNRDLTGKQVEQLIDSIIENHMDALRSELKSVISQLISRPE